jgi:hypothetical protein
LVIGNLANKNSFDFKMREADNSPSSKAAELQEGELAKSATLLRVTLLPGFVSTNTLSACT